MSARFPATNQVLDSIAMLYELSLDVGTSLDLAENCDVFFKKLMARRNLSFCGLYLDPRKLRKDEAAGYYEAVYTFPAHGGGGGLSQLPLSFVRQVHGRTSLCCRSDELASVGAGRLSSELSGGVTSAFSVGDFGVVLCVSQVRSLLYERWQLIQLHALFDKLATSIDACLEHAHLIQETATRLQLQEKLATAKRLESVGLLASGVAHDLNNLLGPLLIYPGMIRRTLPPGSEAGKDLGQIEKAAQQAADVVSSLLALARNAKGQAREPVDLAPVVEAYFRGAAFLEMQSMMPHVALSLEVDGAHPILGNESAIMRATMNLVTNAFEAMVGSGQLNVSLRVRDIDVSTDTYEPIPPGRYSVLEVADSGSGIPSEMIGRVFEPFFSTKRMERSGTGLGLAVVYGLVKDHGGYVDVQSSSSGTAFRLLFPRGQDVTRCEPPLRDPLIFVIDDQRAQAEAAARIVSELDLNVATFTRASDVLAHLDRRPGLALMDVVLGEGQSGVELYAAMRQKCPDLRCILVSGFTDRAEIEQGLRLGASAFLRKPYTASELQHAVCATVGMHPP